MNARNIILFFLILCLSVDSFTQRPIPLVVDVNQLVNVKNKYYLVGKYPNSYTGNATEGFSNSGKLYYQISKGVVRKFYTYNQLGKITIEENFDSTGIYSGNYFEGSVTGDTLVFGTYINGKKEGKWITFGTDSMRQSVNYLHDSVILKRN